MLRSSNHKRIISAFEIFANTELEKHCFAYNKSRFSRTEFYERTWKKLFDTLVTKANKIYFNHIDKNEIDRNYFMNDLQEIVEKIADKLKDRIIIKSN